MSNGLRELEDWLARRGPLPDPNAQPARLKGRQLRRPGRPGMAQRWRQLLSGRARIPPHYRIVEMIGPSCVGKSTLHNQAIRQLKGDWYHVMPTEGDSRPEDDERVDCRLRMYIDRQASSMPANWVTRLRTIRKRDSAMQPLLGSGRAAFFLQEGLCRNFVDPLVETDEDHLRRLLHRRAVIAVSTDDSTAILERIWCRWKGGTRISMYRQSGSLDEIRAMLVTGLERIRLLTARLEAIGVPVLRLEATAPMAENVGRMLEFEGRLFAMPAPAAP